MPGISSLCPMECFTTCRSTRSTTGRTTSLTLSRFPTHPAPASLPCVNGKLKMRRPLPSFSAFRLGESYLSLYDLYQLHLQADLVTLSGCATGLNVVAAGDELLGLIRGLLFAGA